MLETMVHRKVDGLIVIPLDYRASAAAVKRAAHSVAMVQVDREVDGVPTDYVGVDNRAGVRTVLEHLAGQGCRDIVFVSDSGATSAGRARLHAFTEAAQEVRGLSARPPVLGDFSLEFGREAVREIARKPLPDAIACGGDLVALGVVRELRLLKIDVPGDVKVTGFDGILFSELCDPPLTTLRQPVGTIAAEAARLLKARLSRDLSPPQRSEIAPVLVVRARRRWTTTQTQMNIRIRCAFAHRSGEGTGIGDLRLDKGLRWCGRSALANRLHAGRPVHASHGTPESLWAPLDVRQVKTLRCPSCAVAG